MLKSIPPEWLTRPADDLRKLLVLGSSVAADAYCLRYACTELRRGLDAYDAAVFAMREHLRHIGICSIRPAICVLERTTQPNGWSETIEADNTLWGELTRDTIDKLLLGMTFLHPRGSTLRRVHLCIPKQCLVIQQFDEDGSEEAQVCLGLPKGHLSSFVRFARREWELIRSLDRAFCIEPGGLPRADNFAVRDEETQRIARSAILKAIRAGLVVPDP